MGYSYKEKEHLHLWNEKPLIGTTTSLKIISKPLTWWASGLACGEFGWIQQNKKSADKKDPKVKAMSDDEYKNVIMTTAYAYLDKIKCMSTEQYVKLLERAYRKHDSVKDETADDGKDTHSLVERYIKLRMGGNTSDVEPKIRSFVEWCDKNVDRFLWSEAHCCNQDLWVGGICDFGFVHKNGKVYVADAKRSGPYYEQFLQCAGYDIQIKKNGLLTHDGAVTTPPSGIPIIDGYAIFPINEKFKEPFFQHNVADYRTEFVHALQLYKGRDRYERS